MKMAHWQQQTWAMSSWYNHTRHAPVAAISHQNSNLMLFKSLFVKHCATHKL